MEMVDTNYELDINPNEVCRLCLAQPAELLNIYSNSIVDGYIISVPDMLKYTVDIAVATGDKLPNKICSECKKQIITFYTFKQKTKRTEESLFSMFKPNIPLPKQEIRNKTEAVHCTMCDLIFSDDQAYAVHSEQMHAEMLANQQPPSDKMPDIETFTFDEAYENSNDSGTEAKINEIDMLTDVTEPSPSRNKRSASRQLRARSAKKRIIEKPSTSTTIHFKSESEFEDAFDSNDDNYMIAAEEERQDGTDDECLDLYECPMCATQFIDKMDYLSHCKEHDGIEFQCEGCSDMFSDEESLLSHDCVGQDERLTEEELFCIPCNKRLKSATQLNQHNKMHDSMTMILAYSEFFPCHDCCLLYVAKEDLTEHNAENHSDKISKDMDADASKGIKNVDESCTDYQFLDEDKQDFKDVPYACGICNATNTNISELKNHVIFHAKKFPCPISGCGCQYDQMSRLNIHVLNKHINKQNMQCFHCGSPFQTYDELQAHLKYDCKEKKFNCYECDKKFFSKKALVTHLKTLREKKYKCSLCEKLFKQAGELKIHLRSHTNERPFECTVCGKRYKTSSMRAAHMDSHINGKTFECTMCDKKLQSRTSYRNHMKRHVEQKRHICSYCEKKFFTRYHLNLHQSKIHKNLIAEDESVVLEEAVDGSDDMIVYE